RLEDGHPGGRIVAADVRLRVAQAAEPLAREKAHGLEHALAILRRGQTRGYAQRRRQEGGQRAVAHVEMVTIEEGAQRAPFEPRSRKGRLCEGTAQPQRVACRFRAEKAERTLERPKRVLGRRVVPRPDSTRLSPEREAQLG